jgi:uncharacterized membrane protein YkvA (DUF1232 family)
VKFLTNFKQRIRKLKAEAQILAFAYADKRTPLLAKLVIGLTVGYLLSPIDFIPDFIPVLGLLDDFIIVPLLMMVSFKLIPLIVLADARQKMKDNPAALKKNNWVFAILIVFAWLLVLYLAYKKFGHVFFKHATDKT